MLLFIWSGFFFKLTWMILQMSLFFKPNPNLLKSQSISWLIQSNVGGLLVSICVPEGAVRVHPQRSDGGHPEQRDGGSRLSAAQLRQQHPHTQLNGTLKTGETVQGKKTLHDVTDLMDVHRLPWRRLHTNWSLISFIFLSNDSAPKYQTLKNWHTWSVRSFQHHQREREKKNYLFLRTPDSPELCRLILIWKIPS